MPGPSNMKKKRKSQKRSKQSYGRPLSSSSATFSPSPIFDHRDDHDDARSSSSLSPSPVRLLTPPPHTQILGDIEILPVESDPAHDSDYKWTRGFPREHLQPDRKNEVEPITVPPPFIYDPGNGPRVRDTRAFLASKFFAQPPALDVRSHFRVLLPCTQKLQDPLCAEFAQEEVLQMLMTVLPEETALVLWYNKSRAMSRICPACQRLYRLGDVLPDHLPDSGPPLEPPTQLYREQTISGLCSPVCFIVASFNYPGATRSAWGKMEDEFDDYTWSVLNGPGENNAQGDLGIGLSMLMKMTRLPDLGLAQLCLGMDSEDVDGLAEEGWSESRVGTP
ncbi:hypothetical protein DXG03_006894 [Asterophora parasitica]|uniref:Uncharacterized protein n=1 Tax=Asterophora parasitica TaxID=117018 RepID=A0A9P7G4W4_9AGAR|nr:hypothetical protein DXG03_006894 [Asterophora parasitica]